MRRLFVVLISFLVALSFGSQIYLNEIAEIPMGKVGAITSDGRVIYAGVGGAVRIYNVFNRDLPQMLAKIDGFSSKVKQVEVVDGKLFAIWEKEGLRIYNISNPYSPEFIGKFPTTEDKEFPTFSTFEVDGNRMFIAGKGYVAVLDISDPMNPKLIRRVGIDGTPLCMDYYENRLFIADGKYGMFAVGLTPDSRFFLLGHQPGTYTSLQVYNGIIIYGRWDQEKPNEKRIFGRRIFSIPFSTPMAVDIYDGIVYAGGYKNFAIYELVDGNPELVWDLEGMPTLDFGHIDNYLYLANDYQGISVFDITDYHAPIRIGRVETYGAPQRACILDNTLYVAVGRLGVVAFDITNPARPVKLGFVNGIKLATVWDVEAYNGKLYILGARQSKKEDVYIEIADPKTMSVYDEFPVVSTEKGPDQIGRVEINDYFCTVSLGRDGIAVMTPKKDIYETRYIIRNPGSQFYDIELGGDLLYASDYHGGYHIFKLGDGFPKELGYVKTSNGGGNGICLVGKYMLAADGSNGLVVIDISNPEKPYMVTSNPSVWGMDVYVSGDYAYLADGAGQMKVYDISKLPDVELVAELPKNGYWSYILGKDEYIFGIDVFNGVHVYSIGTATSKAIAQRKPTELKILGNYPNPFNAVTEIDFVIPEKSNVDLSIYDASGRLVKKLIKDNLPAGRYTLVWNAGDAPSGNYFAVLNTDHGSVRRRMTLVK